MNPTPIVSSDPPPPGMVRATRNPNHLVLWMARSLAIGLALCAGLQAEPTLERVKLQLKWRHQFQFAGYYAAQEQGYYREAGFQVELLEADPTTDPVKEVVEHRAQYGISNSGLVLARQQGQPVVVLAAIFQHSPMVLIARADPGINSIHDLVGKRVMLERHADELLAYLGQEGITRMTLHPQPHTFNPRDLVEGRIDALSAYSTDEPFSLDRAGLRYLTFTPRTDGIDFYGDNLFTSESELKAKPARVKAFREASMKGWKYAMQHPTELVDLILSRYGERHGRDSLLYEARQMVPLLQPELVEMGYMHEGRWQHIAETYADLGLLHRPYSLQGFLYDPNAADRLIRHRMKLALTLILPLAALLGALTLVFLGLNRRLRRAIHAQVEMGAIIRDNERRFRFIAEHAADVIWTMDIPSGRFTYISPSVIQLRGYTPEEIMSQPASEALSPESAALVRTDLIKSMAEWNAGRPVAPRVMEVDQPHKDGHLVPTEVVTTLHGDSEGRLASVLGISRDITERRRSELRLRHELHSLEELASTDPLTNAWNRRHFGEVVEGEMHRSDRYSHPLSLLLLDIDQFKRINDTYGHAEGDLVLSQVADCVRAAVRISDSLTRWGGEEFIVLMPNTGLSSATIMAERIRESIASHAFPGIGQVTVSIGLSEYVPSASRDAWLERADLAMYRSKQKGRNRVEVDPVRRNTQAATEHLESTFLKLVWSPTYRCGNALIDAQHERLFQLANELLDALLSGRPIDEISEFVASLLREVIRHFHDEEAILTEKGFPGLVAHAKTHAELVAKALELEQTFQAGALSIGSLFQFLAHDVVAQHMLKADREFFHLMAER